MGFGNRIVDTASIALAAEKLTALHETQMFRGHVAGDLARFGQFADSIFPSEKHLDHAQTMRMRERLEALGSLFQFAKLQERHCFFGGGHGGVPYLIVKYIGTLRHGLDWKIRFGAEIGQNAGQRWGLFGKSFRFAGENAVLQIGFELAHCGDGRIAKQPILTNELGEVAGVPAE
jgi:hypothetical protein